ncbi:MAG: hypothetical protein JF593_09300 [Novosphingobium sp.]|nr:hypothetical protein [Novosphingobium sp.]
MAILAGLLLAAAAAAPAVPEGWTVTAADAKAPVLAHTLVPVTIEYRTVPDDYDTLTLTVDPCGQGPWHEKDSIAPQGDTPAARAADLRKAIADEFHNARLNCTLPEWIEAAMLAGFDAAYLQLEAAKK